MKIFKHLKSDWFRYGFETLAVIVGILVAFSLDNWNERRKDGVLEKYYIQRLIEDLNADLTEIDKTVEYASESIVIGNSILEFLGQDYLSDIRKSSYLKTVAFIEQALDHYEKEISRENLGSYLGYLFDVRIVDMNNFTYNELISTGNFEVIENPALRKNLTSSYLKFTAVIDIQDNLLTAIIEYNRILQKNNIPIINTLSFEDLEMQLETDQGLKLQTSLKNLIWDHAYAITLFHYEFRALCLELIYEANTHFKQL